MNFLVFSPYKEVDSYKQKVLDIDMALYGVLVKFWLFYLLLLAKAANYHIYQSLSPPNDTYVTLNNYKNDADKYFTSNSTFLLEKGCHQVLGLLKLEDISNVTFKGAGIEMTEIKLEPEASIAISNSSFIEFQALTITKQGQNNNSAYNSSFIIRNSKFVLVTDVVFMQNNLEQKFSRALSISDSYVEIRNCSFYNGCIKNGGAVFATASNLTFSERTFFGNNSANNSAGGIYAEDCVLNFTGNSNFTANQARKGGGAVYLHKSLMILSGIVKFINNMGSMGGALYLKGGAQTMFESNSDIAFISNEAKMGGAIFILDSNARYISQCHHLPISEPMSCFFRVEAFFTNVQLNFEQNYTNLSGAAIFGGFLEVCRVQINDVQSNMSGYEYLKTMCIFNNHSNENSLISSKPLKICLCEEGKPKCSKSHTINIVPGRVFNISVVSVGQLNMPVPSYIQSIFHESKNTTEFHPELYNFELTNKCHDIGFKVLTSERETNLTLYPEGCNSPSSNLLVTIEKDDCPPGFQLMENSCKCDKRFNKILSDNESCQIETGLIKRPKNIWFQPNINETYHDFLWGHCLTTYCKADSTWLDFNSSLTDDQCHDNRTGILCGACKKNYSLVLNSLDCQVCENRYLGLLILFVFAGILLIATLLLLQMTVANGTINGLILYCNVVGICFNKFFPLDKARVPPLPVFIAWVNLDFGIPTCLYDGLDHYTYTWLQFVFPFYLWFLIGLIIIGCKLSSRIGKMLGSNPVAVLATIILMSFTKLLQTAEEALSYNPLYSSSDTQDIYWRMDSNIKYFTNKHIPLAIFSVLIVAFLLLPYIFLLALGYRLQKYSGKKGFRWFNRFKPLLDAYYAPYNKSSRYWTGLLLLVRSCLFLSLPIIRENNAVLVTIPSLFAFLMTFAWLKSRIYDKLYVEILEASFILNLCMLGIASFHVRMVGGDQLSVTYTSASIAFAEFVGIVIFHMVLRISKVSCRDFEFHSIEDLNKFLVMLKIKQQSDYSLKEIKHENTVNVSLREPLLDDATEL